MENFLWNEYLLRVGLVILITYGFLFISQKIMSIFFEKTDFIDKRKEETILGIYKTTTNFLGLIIVIVAALNPFVDLTKILAGAGVLGVVLGFGAQSLIKDILTGFFMIYERQIRNGDFVTINQKYKGTVEEMGFRVLRIRQWDGNQLIIPNGEIKEILNGNVQKRRMLEPVVASFRENPTTVIEVLEEVCAELNEKFEEYLYTNDSGEIEEAFQVRGISDLNALNHGYEYTVIGLVKDAHYFDVIWESRKLIAQKLYDKEIKMAEENVRYQARMHL